MGALLGHSAQLRALQEYLQRVDPIMATALQAHTAATVEADAVLREANIKLAELQTHRTGTGTPISDLTSLRDRIDVLLQVVPRALPVNQEDED